MAKNDESLEKLYAESLKNDNTFTIETTVVTGLEWEASDECREKLGKHVQVIKRRGRIYFNIDWDQFPKVEEMRSIDNIFIIGDMITFAFENNKEADLEKIENHVLENMHLEKAIDAWKRATNFTGKLYPTVEEHTAAKEQALAAKTETLELYKKEKEQEQALAAKTETLEMYKEEKEQEQDPPKDDCGTPETPKGKKRGQDPSESKEDDILRYRVTCERNKDGKHAFESQNVAMVIGGKLQDKYHWMVDLSMYHLEVVCKLTDGELITYLRVTHESKHRRNIASFGPTTLRSTICYSLLRLANPKLGDVIIDPMCGGGSIPIEAAIVFPNLYVLCGDNNSKAIERTKSNMDASTAGCKIDLMQWTALKLPFKDSFVDIVVTDMPFGKRSGKKSDNKFLYEKFLLELGRVVKISSGRLVLLTYDRSSFKEALLAAGDLFWVTKNISINVGGLNAAVYVLSRTNVLHDKLKPRFKQYSYPKKYKNFSSAKLGSSTK